MKNFARLSRTIVRALDRHPIALLVYVHLLTRARFAPGMVSSGHGDVVRLEIGEAVFGYDEMANLCGVNSRTTIRAATDRLQKLGILVIRSNNRGSIARLLNLEETGDNNDTEVSADWTAGATTDCTQPLQQPAQLSDPNKKGKTDKKEKKAKREPLPLDWSPPSELSKKAEDAGMSPDEIAVQWERFVNDCRSKAKTSADWFADASTWISRGIEYRRSRAVAEPAMYRITDLDEEDRKRKLLEEHNNRDLVFPIGDCEVIR